MAKWTLIHIALLGLAFAACTSESERAIQQTAQHVEEVTEGHTRVVWAQDTQQRNDVFVRGNQLRLIAYDSRDGQRERVLLPGPGNFTKPMITPDGSQVIYTDNTGPAVYVVDWTGSTVARRLTDGTALAVWRDPASGTDWVYVARQPAETRAPAYHSLTRHALDEPDRHEAVALNVPVGEDNFQLSADGRIAGGNFPWPDCGIVHLDEGRFEHLGRGCWTALAPDNSYLFWIFDGAHRNLLMFNTQTGDRWTVNISEAPGIDGHEAYHPRWSNHPRIMTLTGPYLIRSGGNNIRGGGASVEVRIGRFSADFQQLEKWVQVSSNDWANFAPDVWIEPDDATGNDTAGTLVSTTPQEARRPATVRVRLIETSQRPMPDDILPYTQGLIAHAYEVVDVIEGELSAREILIAHWIIRDGQSLPGADRAEGAEFVLHLERYDQRPDLEGERLSMDIDNLLLTLYYDTTS